MGERFIPLAVVYLKDEDGGWAVYAPGVDGAISQGDSIREARENIIEAIELVLDQDLPEDVQLNETVEIPGDESEVVMGERFVRIEDCPDCGGSGAGYEITPWKTNPCNGCDGRGFVVGAEVVELEREPSFAFTADEAEAHLLHDADLPHDRPVWRWVSEWQEIE